MINLFTEKYPDSMLVNGTEYPVHTDFRVWVAIKKMLDELNRSPQSEEEIKQFYLTICEIIATAFGEIISEPYVDTIVAMTEFLKGNEPVRPKIAHSNSPVRDINFDIDCNYIIAGFLQDYGIDLCHATEMHYWKFKILLDNLSEKTAFSKIMGFLSMDLSKISDAEQRQFYQDMQLYYSKPLSENEQKRNEKIIDILRGSGDMRELDGD